MYYEYSEDKNINVPEPFKRIITPLFMADDPVITGTAFSVHITEWDPGGQVDLHTHADATEAMYCMTGTGEVIINDEVKPFKPDTMIVAPPGINHMIRNTGNERLRVLCIFSPPVTGEDLRNRALKTVEACQ